ncbi:hypothetical protein HA402_015170 [Bradysia odoriphaga]|nr:hypothetical protein HA402_015170 [Bradysia odoriphaga]
MLKLDRSSSYSDLRKFLEDIYIYLTNQTTEQNESSTAIATELINRCKDILNIYETEHDTKVEQPYLEMNGNNKIDPPCEYVDVTSPVKTSQDELYSNDVLEIECNEEAITGLKVTDFETNVECPFSGLPAAHLLIKKSPKVGYLQRIKDKTYIFNQSRIKFYSGLLDGWLLMYSNSCDLKPTICLNLQNYDLCNSDLFRKREQFQLISNEYKADNSRSPKKYLLQAASANDYEEWLQAITEAAKSSLIRRRLNSVARKLPSPPASVETDPIPRLSDRSEGIYEEPSEMLSTQFYQSFQFDNWTQLPVAPALPVKSGMKCKSECSTASVAYDIPKSPPKPTVPDLDHQNKIQQVKTQLTKQMLSPKQATKVSSTDEGMCKEKPKKKTKVEASEMPKFSKRNWFVNRLSGRNMGSSGKLKMETDNGALSDIPMSCDSSAENRLDGKRGGKVNMIINQLEANGHFQLKKEKFKDNRYSKFSIANGDDDDELDNYEPVSISGRNTK